MGPGSFCAGDPMHEESCPKGKFPLRCHQRFTQVRVPVYNTGMLRCQNEGDDWLCPSDSREGFRRHQETNTIVVESPLNFRATYEHKPSFLAYYVGETFPAQHHISTQTLKDGCHADSAHLLSSLDNKCLLVALLLPPLDYTNISSVHCLSHEFY